MNKSLTDVARALYGVSKSISCKVCIICKEDDGTLRLIENKTKKFIPKENEDYWYITNMGDIGKSCNNNSAYDKWIMDHQLVFKTEEEAREYKKFVELLDEYRDEIDWKDFYTNKYYLYYDNKNDKIYIGCGLLKLQGAFHFKSSKSAEEFIVRAGEYDIKRFMFDVWE